MSKNAASPSKTGVNGAAGGQKSAEVKDLKRELKATKRQVACLREDVGRLEIKLSSANGKVERWRSEAKEGRTRIAKLEARTKRLQRQQHAAGKPEADPAVESGDVPLDPPTFDESWTVVQLRDAARDSGVKGFSRMTKTQLLDALQ